VIEFFFATTYPLLTVTVNNNENIVMPLTELPPELLDNIIEKTRPDGFEAIALACRTTYAVAKGYIDEHNTLKRRFRQVILTDYGRPIHTGRLLLDVLRRPLAALYIEGLHCHPPGHHEGCQIDEPTDEDLAMVNKFLRCSPYLRFTQEQAEACSARLFQTDAEDLQEMCNYSTALLLTILPNVRRLSLPWHWGAIRSSAETDQQSTVWPGIWQVLDQLTQAANSGPAGNAPLGKLQTLLPYAEIEYDSFPKNALMELLPFMEMRSVREIYTTNCIAVDDGYTGIPFTWRHPEVSSNLRTLELTGCCIDGDGIGKLLAHTPLLTSLKYSHATKWHGCEHDW